MNLSGNETDYQKLTTRFRDWSLLNSCASLLGWDERTYLPATGINHRSDQMALLARMSHEMLTSTETADLLAQLETLAKREPADLDAAATIREIRQSAAPGSQVATPARRRTGVVHHPLPTSLATGSASKRFRNVPALAETHRRPQTRRGAGGDFSRRALRRFVWTNTSQARRRGRSRPFSPSCRRTDSV